MANEPRVASRLNFSTVQPDHREPGAWLKSASAPTPFALSKLSRSTLSVFALALPWGISQAESPSAGDATQQLQRQRQEQLEQNQGAVPDVHLKPPVAAAPGRLPNDETPCFPIARIAVSGAMAGRFAWLPEAAARTARGEADPWRGRCLGTRGVNMLVARMQDALVARGWVTTRVVAAPQSLKGGELELVVVPGVVRRIVFEGQPSLRNNAWDAFPIAPGDLLNLRDVEQGLENLRRLPTVSADVHIAPAAGADAQAGQSDLLVQRQQGFPLRLNASVDNSGTKETGMDNGSITLSGDDLLGLNDAIYVNATHDLGGGNPTAKGNESETLHVDVPYGYWSLGATANDSTYYQTVAGAAGNEIYSGDTGSTQFSLSRVVQRGQITRTTLSGQLWEEHSHNDIDGVEVPIQRRQMAGWQLGAAEHVILGEDTLDGDLNWKQGTGADGSLTAPEQASGTGSSRMRIMTADASLSDPFKAWGRQLQYTMSARGQWNGTALVPLDRFSIGSRYTVRGFDGEETLAGDSGWFVRNELGWALPRLGAQAYVGLDHGEVGGPNARYLLGTRLTGAALGLRGSLPYGLSYDLYVGTPVSKPDGFITARQVFAFTLSVSI